MSYFAQSKCFTDTDSTPPIFCTSDSFLKKSIARWLSNQKKAPGQPLLICGEAQTGKYSLVLFLQKNINNEIPVTVQAKQFAKPSDWKKFLSQNISKPLVIKNIDQLSGRKKEILDIFFQSKGQVFATAQKSSVFLDKYFEQKIYLPPLRARPQDIRYHSLKILRSFNLRVTSEAQALLFDYIWPNGVFQLTRCLRLACEKAAFKKLNFVDYCLLSEEISRFNSLKVNNKSLLSSLDISSFLECASDLGIANMFQLLEEALFEQAFKEYGGLSQVARVLKISKSTLASKTSYKNYKSKQSVGVLI